MIIRFISLILLHSKQGVTFAIKFENSGDFVTPVIITNN
jgi:hypothetical protein